MRYQTVQGQPATPPKYSLLGLAGFDDFDHRYSEGTRWLPENVTGGNTAAITTAGNTASKGASVPEPPAELQADAFLLWTGEKASTLGAFGRDFLDRAKRLLAAVESYQAAAEMWDGGLGRDEGQHLAHPDSDRITAVGAAVSITAAVGRMEGALAAGLDGQRGMVHMTPQALAEAAAADAIRREGPQWQTPMGHLVVADAGYSGDGPGAADTAGTTQFIYGTAMIRVRLGQVEVRPGNLKSIAAVNQDTNLDTVVVQRPCVIEWNEAAHFTAEVSITVPTIGGAS